MQLETTFRYSVWLRYVLRGSMPAIGVGLFLFSVWHARSWDAIFFGGFCVLFGAAGWFVFRRYGLSFVASSEGMAIQRGSSRTFFLWGELASVRFSASDVKISAGGKTWRALSELSDWGTFERLLRAHASATALAGCFALPFRVRTKWGSWLQTGAVCLVFAVAALREMFHGDWAAAFTLLGLSGLFLYFVSGVVLWYRFDEDQLLVQHPMGRERYDWSQLQMATATESALIMQFANDTVATLDGSQIKAGPKDVFASLEKLWQQKAHGLPSVQSETRRIWSWPWALFWWLILPVAGLLFFPGLMGRMDRWGRMMPMLSVVILLLLFGGVGGIHLASRSCRRRKERLSAVFPPALAAMFVLMVFLLVGQTVLLAALLYYLPLLYANVVLPWLLVAIALALALACYRLIRNAWRAFHPLPIDIAGLLATRDDQPQLWRLAESVAEQLGAPRPDHVFLLLEPNYFVTEARVRIGRDIVEGFSIGLSVPMTRAFSEGELKAMVGHELGHFRGWDTEFSKHFFPLYNAAAEALPAMAQAYASWALTPSLYVLQFFIVSFRKIEAELSREREHRADRAGAEAGSAADLASALIKLELLAPRVASAVARLTYTDCPIEGGFEGETAWEWPTTVSMPMQERSRDGTIESHPTLFERIEALGFAEPALPGVEGDGAIKLIHNPAAIEETLIERGRESAKAAKVSPLYTFVAGTASGGPTLK